MARAPFVHALIGQPCLLPDTLLREYPELGAVHWRRGGLPTRVGGWFLGRDRVAAITFWNVVFLAPGVPAMPELLLHELAHVHQFQESLTFPLRYVWESIRRGYYHNRFEVEARTFAAGRVHGSSTSEAKAVPRA